MADFAAARPVESEKLGAFLHDRKNRPAAPTWARADMAKRFAPIVLGVVFAACYIAIAFQTWAWWDNGRAWAVALTAPLWALGGFGAAHLAMRREWRTLALGVPFLIIGLILMWANAWRGEVTEGQDNARDAMTIISAICFLIAVHCGLLGAIWAEARRPTRVPRPEM